MPVFLLIAGPNGAGKSTFGVQVLEPLWKACYQKEIAVLNPDTLARELRKIDPALTLYDSNVKAVNMIERAVSKYFELKQSFAVETVLSTQKYLPYWNMAPNFGFERILFYVALPSPEEALARVVRRVQAGGHDVPQEKVIKRFWRSLENFRVFAEKADGFLVFENRRDKGYFAVACGRLGEVKILQDTDFPIGNVLQKMTKADKFQVSDLLSDFCGPFPYLGPFPR